MKKSQEHISLHGLFVLYQQNFLYLNFRFSKLHHSGLSRKKSYISTFVYGRCWKHELVSQNSITSVIPASEFQNNICKWESTKPQEIEFVGFTKLELLPFFNVIWLNPTTFNILSWHLPAVLCFTVELFSEFVKSTRISCYERGPKSLFFYSKRERTESHLSKQ